MHVPLLKHILLVTDFIGTHVSCVSLRFSLVTYLYYLCRQESRDDVGSADGEGCLQEEKVGGEGEEAQTSRAGEAAREENEK